MVEGIELFTSNVDTKGKKLEQKLLELQVDFKKINVFSDLRKAIEMVNSGHLSVPVIKYVDKLGVNFISGDGIVFKSFLDRLDAQLKGEYLGGE